MKADYQKWVDATANLKARRKLQKTVSDNPTYQNPVADYRLHLIKCGYGRSILDVGCGAQFLKTQIPANIQYFGLDAFPAEGYEDATIPFAIEDFVEDIEFGLTVISKSIPPVDTVCAFAVLDNCRDFDKSIQAMKIIARKNIIILTGIDIPVDQYHTFCLQMSDFDSRFTDWKCTHREEIVPKVWLLNYDRT